MSNHLSGSAAEFKVSKAFKTAGCKPVSIDMNTLLSATQNSSIGRRRMSLATKYLTLEYGTPQSDGSISLDWQEIPASVFLDYVLAVDVLISYRGWTIALDVTTDKSQVDSKLNKLKALSGIHKELGIDKSGVLLVESSASPLTIDSIKSLLSSIIKNSESLVSTSI